LLVVFALSPVPEMLEAEVVRFASTYLILPSLAGLGRFLMLLPWGFRPRLSYCAAAGDLGR
jgi:hypothetical protein